MINDWAYPAAPFTAGPRTRWVQARSGPGDTIPAGPNRQSRRQGGPANSRWVLIDVHGGATQGRREGRDPGEAMVEFPR